jgi:hypothetical protein
MRLVILESPFRGRTLEETARNKRYAETCMLDSLRRGESPLASHLLWPGILDDADPAERQAGIAAGLAWGQVAHATVVYVDFGISEGMAQGIRRAQAEGRPVEYRCWKEKGATEAAPSQENAPMHAIAAQAAE